MMYERRAGGIAAASMSEKQYRRARGAPPTGLWAFSLALVGLGHTPLFAIPSPDVVIGLFASAAQVLGLVTVALGSVAYQRKRRGAAAGARGGGGSLKWPLRILAVLFLASLVANVLQYTSHVDQRTARLRRNLHRSSTENGAQVGDANLKTLSFSGQLEHPWGISSTGLAEAVGRQRDEPDAKILELVDVREPEEAEMGGIEGSWHIRYPDLRIDKERLIHSAETIVLVCYSGNRSSELCEEFREAGIPCRFLIGGYEKWIAEERPLVRADGRKEGELRGLPEFPAKHRLLDTPEVEHLVASRDPVFVDVRYEGDFARGHIPGAVNLPLRKMRSAAMNEAIEGLPKDRPVIAVCYDKRSSFYGAILGLRVTRAGGQFAGRYTVPHEFVVAKAARPHVEKFLEANNAGLVGWLSKPLVALLEKLDSGLGHLALAIACAVLLLRLLVLPLTWKNERDQMVGRRLEPRIAEIKKRFADDPARASRGVIKLQREAKMTPARNLLGSLVQISLFLVFFAAVSNVSKSSVDGFLWMDKLAEADPWLILPTLLAGLVFLLLELGGKKHGTTQHLMRLAAAGLLFAITFRLAAALNLYLVLNIGLLLIQNRILARVLAKRDVDPKSILEAEPLPAQAVASLSLAHRVPDCGNKALRLGQLRAAGFPVPNGFVCTAELYEDADAKGTLRLSSKNQRALRSSWRQLGADLVAVRSSGLNEDGEDQSYAGIFESLLNVDHAGLVPALEEVGRSLNSSRAAAYSGFDAEVGGVLVQEMVAAEYAGVLFTEHPMETGSLLIEMVEGLGESLVSGTATPEGYRYGRLSHEPLDENQAPIDLRPLIELSLRVEALYDKPQDIEWAYRDGRFLLLQTRDITAHALSGKGARGATRRILERERRRLLDRVKRSKAPIAGRKQAASPSTPPVFAQNELSELLPRPTPLSLSMMRALWAPGGSTEIACRELGVPYHVDEDEAPVVETVYGALYVNRWQEAQSVGKGPGMACAFRMARSAEGIEAEFREEFLGPFLRDIRLRETMDLRKLSAAELIRLFLDWQKGFVEETYVQAERINIAADFYVKSAEEQLRRNGLEPAEYLSELPTTVVHQAMSMLPEIRAGLRPQREFVGLFGHRAPHDYELAAPRYRESQELVEELVERASRLDDMSLQSQGESVDAAEESEVNRAPLPEKKLLAIVVERARKFQALKEEAKHHALREFALLRSVLLAIDRKLELCGQIFQLEIGELRALASTGHRRHLLRVIEARRVRGELFERVQLPTTLRQTDIERLTISDEGCTLERRETSQRPEGLSGALVSGSSEVVGPARVIRDSAQIDAFRDGEVLIARFTDPTWTPLFPRAAAVVTEVGGRLSHAAIVAREYGVTAVVGVENLFDSIETGDLVKVGLNGSIEKVEQRNTGLDIVASLRRQDEILAALVLKISDTGALIETDADLDDGQSVTLQLESENRTFEAEVVRCAESQRYGLRFCGGPSPLS